MPYDRQSWYVTFGGGLGGGEEWQTGIHLALGETGTPLVDPLDADAHACYDIASAFITSPGSYVSTDVRLSWCKVVRKATSGLDAGASALYETSSYVNGGSVGPTAFQLAAVISLRSGATFGQANYGRMYIPCVGGNQIANGRFSDAMCGTLADNAKTFVDAMNTYAESTAHGTGFSTFHVRLLSKVGTGTSKLVTNVEVGNVPDTQRRRRNNLAEAYTNRIITD